MERDYHLFTDKFLDRSLHCQRQSGIGEELLDVVAGFEALKH